MTRASKPAAPACRGSAQEGGAQVGCRSRRVRRSRPAAAATPLSAATSVTRAPRSSAAATIATPIRPVERLPMNRTGSIASRVPPAVTTMCRPSRSASRAGVDERRAGGGVRRPDRPVGHGRDHGVHDPRPRPGGPRRTAPTRAGRRRARRSRSRSRRPAARRWPVSRDASTCRRPSPGRRRPAPTTPGTSR